MGKGSKSTPIPWIQKEVQKGLKNEIQL
ncbi:uncharacterized protein G2W53_032713 [Senna tora]|uniref:Uncharacterized protein n=1 Tax=Senna tora TaxID=362788 RepID=A0A834SYS6_9FABA|nr:uncharacterized protein G2W53_032713 [Senna tora]